MYQIYETFHNKETGKVENFNSLLFAIARMNDLIAKAKKHYDWHIRGIAE